MPKDRPLRLLVIEDDPVTFELLRTVLERSGVKVEGTSRMEEGLKKAATDLPDLILMDIQLPDGNGLDAVEILRKGPKTAHIPVIALSGLDPKYYRPRALAAGCMEYISKPFKVYDLAQSLQRWLPSQPRC